MRYYARRSRRHPSCRVDTVAPLRQAMEVAERGSKSPSAEQKRLAQAVLARREELGLTQEEFAERAGLALKTIQRVELGQVVPRTKTFRGLDDGAAWSSGSARAVFRDGRGPVPQQAKRQLTPEAQREEIMRALFTAIVQKHPELLDTIREEWTATLKRTLDAVPDERLSDLLDTSE